MDLNSDSLLFHGKGMNDCRVRFGPKTGHALTKFLRARSRRKSASSTVMWLPARGAVPLSSNGIKLMLRRRGVLAGVDNVRVHRWRHNFAHEWKLAGGDTGDLMLVLGWSSDDMPRRFSHACRTTKSGRPWDRSATRTITL